MVSSGVFGRKETHGIVTPLGVQFVDDVTGLPVSRGLEVWTWPEGAAAKRVPVRLAGSATYAAHGLPGLREFETGSGDADFWQKWLASSPSAGRKFVVDVRDLENRFLPLQVRVDVPALGRVRPSCASLLPASRRDAVPLFSASTRSVRGTMAMIRAELYDQSSRMPAAWAVVEARMNGQTIARGMSDRDGRVVLLFAYPEPLAIWASPPSGPTSPPPMLPLAEQRWPVDIAVRYDRTLLGRDVPDLCAALAQSPATLLADAARPSFELTGITLRYGETAILRTANTLGEERGYLLVVTSGSPL